MQLAATDIPPRKATVVQIPDGPEGTRITLRYMRSFVREGKKHLPVIMVAREILRDARISQGNSKEWSAEIRAVFEFVRTQISYVKDVFDVETLQSPEATLFLGTGDCDDKCTLAACLLATLGHPTRFVALRFNPNVEFSHVILETRLGSRWIKMDCTLDYPLGFAPTGDEAMVVHNQ